MIDLNVHYSCLVRKLPAGHAARLVLERVRVVHLGHWTDHVGVRQAEPLQEALDQGRALFRVFGDDPVDVADVEQRLAKSDKIKVYYYILSRNKTGEKNGNLIEKS
jgi:hypothetical protein